MVKLRDLLIGVPLSGDGVNLEMEIYSISYDSRTTRPGALFVALPGTKDNGDLYVETAFERGAVCAICRQAGEGQRLLTDDPHFALATISANWFGHPGDGMTLIAVTGTNGKTTTTNLIKAMLEGVTGQTVGLIGTNRNMIGALELNARRTTPESYELQRLLRKMANAGCAYVVMEVSSHALAQRRIEGLHFAVGVFTNLSQDHLDYHKTMEEYRNAKGRLFRQCHRAVLNLDDEAGRWYQGRMDAPALTYSERRDEADLTARNVRLFPGHVEFEAVAVGQIARVHLPIPGGFSIYNALAALCCGMALGLRLEACVCPLRSVSGVKGRIEVVAVPCAYTVIIDYAHTPNALENILSTARSFTAGRLICLFGCGGDRDKSKRPLMGRAAAERSDLLVVTSDNPRSEDPQSIIDDILPGFDGWDVPCHIEPDRRTAIHWALAEGKPGDVIILAGKGHETYQEIAGETLHFDEREIIADYFASERDERQKSNGKALVDMLK